MNVTALSNDDLVSRVRSLNAEGNRVLANLLVHLGEMDARELYKRHACSSMFMFCRKLGMSEGSTARRLDSARAVRRFPNILPRIESGELHLTALSIVCGILTPENVESLIGSIAGKTKREVEEIRVRYEPKADVKDMIRKVSPGTSAPLTLPAPPPVAAAAALVAPMPVATESPRTLPLLASVAVTAPVIRIAKPVTPIVPIKEDGYKVQFQASKAIVDKIDRVKEMMRHRNPKGDLATIFEAALDRLIADLEKERFAATARPQNVVRACAPGHVAAATRREVFERDGRQCTFTDDEGHRCPERGWLELDHIDPAALSGSDEAKNLRVRCRAHNQMHAKDIFGADYVERRIEASRRDRRAARPTRAHGRHPSG